MIDAEAIKQHIRARLTYKRAELKLYKTGTDLEIGLRAEVKTLAALFSEIEEAEKGTYTLTHS